jgi:hypothetical protein
MKNQGGRIMVTWQPYQPSFLDSSMVDDAVGKLGGLPHD